MTIFGESTLTSYIWKSIIVQKNRMIQVASHVLALRYRGHANDMRSIVKILFSAKS